jgi:hypothetical protein
MQVVCPSCTEKLEFSGVPPRFCAFCGHSLAAAMPAIAEPQGSEDKTAAPAEQADIATAADAPRTELGVGVPEAIGGYRLLHRLGGGGMGAVYEAEDLTSGRHVALKLLLPEYAGSPDALLRFRQEGRLASTLAHPRCVFVLAADEEAGRPYIVMELMPGETLHDLVRRRGQLPPEEAIAKILDVIDGLREAHRLGLVHRDVKPSNCFVEENGRVKIGDFGLARSLVQEAKLTRTGSFIGTPLYAAPEQVKLESVDAQSDVYSVAATLYFLLTGRAPFQSGDAMATLARIVSDPAPSMRTLRPDLPSALDRVVLRGLERDRSKRWRNLDELYTALEVFVPGRLSKSALGIRFGAYLIDYVLVTIVAGVVNTSYHWLSTGSFFAVPRQTIDTDLLVFTTVINAATWCLYFILFEWLWSCTLGKRWLRLRVARAQIGEPPGLIALVVRTGILYFLTSLFSLTQLLFAVVGAKTGLLLHPDWSVWYTLGMACTIYTVGPLGIVLILCTMRPSNGYRGLHEFLSGTRVVQLPEAVEKHVELQESWRLEAVPSADLPARIGAFEVHGVLSESDAGSVLLGFDRSLQRRVWIWLRPPDAPPLSAARREVSRAGRLRWLAGAAEEMRVHEGASGPVQWDAFLAPQAGMTLASASPGTRTWGQTRNLLGQLAEELLASKADGTVPATLSRAHVWVRPDGRLSLLDHPIGPLDGPADLSLLALLRVTAIWALDTTPRQVPDRPIIVGVPYPPHATAILDRLLGSQDPYKRIADLQADLAESADQPAQTTRARRLAHVALLGALVSAGLCVGLFSLPFYPLMGVAMSSIQIQQNEMWRERLDAVAAVDAANVVTAPDPASRRRALKNAFENARLDALLVKRLETDRRRQQSRVDTMGPYSRKMAGDMEKMFAESAQQQGGMKAFLPPVTQPDQVRRMVEMHTQMAPEMFHEVFALIMAISATFWAVFWPPLWIASAFVFRGGVSYWIMGLALVRGDGRPALRFQCAWRAIMVWVPPAALAVTSVWLDYWYLYAGPGASPWLLTASSAAWWTAAVLIPIYVILALLFPKRSLHDILAGTHVVPR